MSIHQPQKISVTWDQVAAFRLAQHHLLERAPKEALLSVADDMTGAQAQLLSAAEISLWARIRGLESTHIKDAFQKRILVKASGMRRTLFLFPSEEVAVFVRGSTRRAEKEIRWAHGKGVSERVLDATIEAALGVLDRPLTRPEIAELTSNALGVQARMVNGGGWGSRRQLAAVPVGHLNYPVVDLLHLVAARGVVCYGPTQGKEPTFVRADAWIPNFQDVPQEEAERLLLRKYLRAFGPATPADFAMWMGISLGEAREIWTREAHGFVSVNVEGWAGAVLREDVKKLMKAEFERPHVRLLPYFDTFLLGHRERGHLVSPKLRGRVYRPQGWIAPVILVDGRVMGVWEYVREADRLRVTVTKFETFSRRVSARIYDEAQDFARFLEVSGVDVKILRYKAN